jgi:hypothetical protein
MTEYTSHVRRQCGDAGEHEGSKTDLKEIKR